MFNDRGTVIFAAHVTERMMPGVVRVPNGANYNPVEVGRVEKGGAVNTISPLNTVSKNAFGMAVNAYLVEVKKWEGGTL